MSTTSMREMSFADKKEFLMLTTPCLIIITFPVTSTQLLTKGIGKASIEVRESTKGIFFEAMNYVIRKNFI